MSDLYCDECGGELVEDDYFGPRRQDHYFTPSYIERKGTIFKCADCGENYYWFDNEEILHQGYPC